MHTTARHPLVQATDISEPADVVASEESDEVHRVGRAFRCPYNLINPRGVDDQKTDEERRIPLWVRSAACANHRWRVFE